MPSSSRRGLSSSTYCLYCCAFSVFSSVGVDGERGGERRRGEEKKGSGESGEGQSRVLWHGDG